MWATTKAEKEEKPLLTLHLPTWTKAGLLCQRMIMTVQMRGAHTVCNLSTQTIVEKSGFSTQDAYSGSRNCVGTEKNKWMFYKWEYYIDWRIIFLLL
jgi:hypothetical protein